jgi:hypothetical protein
MGVFLFMSRGNSLDRTLHLGVFLGAPVLEVRSPSSSERYAPGAVQVLVAWSDAERIAPGTLRCLLNGRDVTHQLTVGSNGAAGRVFPVREGSNSLRLEVYARGLWAERYFEDHVDLDFQVRPAPRLDQT